MTEEQILSRWKSLAGATSEEPWTSENLAGFFQTFRPHGDHLADVFEGVVGASDILPRLMEVYEATAEGYERGDAYFIVKNPKPLSVEHARELASLHLQSMGEIARTVGNKRL